MTYLFDYFYWKFLFRSIKVNKNKNIDETNWINSHPINILNNDEHWRWSKNQFFFLKKKPMWSDKIIKENEQKKNIKLN